MKMTRVTKREAQRQFPQAFRGVGGCDPILLEPGGTYYVDGRGGLYFELGDVFRWHAHEACWDETLDPVVVAEIGMPIFPKHGDRS